MRRSPAPADGRKSFAHLEAAFDAFDTDKALEIVCTIGNSLNLGA